MLQHKDKEHSARCRICDGGADKQGAWQAKEEWGGRGQVAANWYARLTLVNYGHTRAKRNWSKLAGEAEAEGGGVGKVQRKNTGGGYSAQYTVQSVACTVAPEHKYFICSETFDFAFSLGGTIACGFKLFVHISDISPISIEFDRFRELSETSARKFMQ